MNRYKTAKALDDFAEKAADLGDRIGGTKTGDRVDKALSIMLGPLRDATGVGCTRPHGHDDLCEP